MQSLQDIGAFRPDAFDEPDRKIPQIGSARTHHFGVTGSMRRRILQPNEILLINRSKRLNEQCSRLQSSTLLIEGERRLKIDEQIPQRDQAGFNGLGVYALGKGQTRLVMRQMNSGL